MGQGHRLTKEQRENLVAFIDGELEQDTMRDIEKTLSDNPVAHHEVDMLRKTWNLLDYLDRPEASERVVEQTLTSLEVMQTNRKFEMPAWWSQVRKGVVYTASVAGMVFALVVGYTASNYWLPSRSDAIARDLELIEEYDELQEIGSVAFLELLQENNLVEQIKKKSGGPPQPGFPGNSFRNR